MSRFGLGSFGHLGGGNDQFTKILLHFDGNLTDTNLGGSAHTWTAHGSSFVTSGQKFGTGALQCPYIDTPAHADFNLGSGDWTIDFWFDTLAAGNGTVRRLCGQSDSAVTPLTESFFIALGGTNLLAASIGNGTALPSAIVGTTAITTSGLHHAEINRYGNVLQLFLDGTKNATDVAFFSTVPNSISNFSVGRAGESVLTPFSGLIDEFRLSVGIARHTANFTPATQAYG